MKNENKGKKPHIDPGRSDAYRIDPELEAELARLGPLPSEQEIREQYGYLLADIISAPHEWRGAKRMEYRDVQNGQHCNANARGAYVVGNLAALVTEHGITPNAEIDLSKETPVVVAMGQQRSSGFNIDVLLAVYDGKDPANRILTLYTQETAPKEGAIVIQVMTQPYQLIALEGKLEPGTKVVINPTGGNYRPR